jgi:hypothetical protein
MASFEQMEPTCWANRDALGPLRYVARTRAGRARSTAAMQCYARQLLACHGLGDAQDRGSSDFTQAA